MSALVQQAHAAPTATNPQTPASSSSLGPDGGLGGKFKRAGEPFAYMNTCTGTLVVLECDLTVDWRSTPYELEDGNAEKDDDDYFWRMYDILYRLLVARDQGYCDTVIVTRNSVANVEATINKCAKHQEMWARSHGEFIGPRFSSDDFPIISYPEDRVLAFSNRKCKAQLLYEYFPHMEDVDKVVFVDHSHGNEFCEHERFDAYGLPGKYSHNIEICHVKVRQCSQHMPYGYQGLGNQIDKLDEIATEILSTDELPKWTWKELQERLDWWEEDHDY